MKKKIITIALTISMLATSTVFSFASTGADGEQVKQVLAKKDAAIVENMVGTDDVVNQISKTRKGFVAELEGLDISIPKEGVNPVETELSTGENISMGLPGEVTDAEGVLTENGTVVYNSKCEDVDVIVQATKNETKSGEKEWGVRTTIVIENATAPHKYEFKFKIPKGSKFVSGKELKTDEIGNDAIAIMGDDGFIHGIIKAPWAKDAEGKSLDTFFTINGDIILQHVEFDRDTKFPVVADPWYGTSSKTENIGTTFKQGFTAYAAGQGTDGFYFDKLGGDLFYSRGSGATASVNISLGVGYGAATLSANIGTASKGGGVTAGYPVPKVAGWYKLRVTEYYNIQKYKVLRRWKDPATNRVSWKEFHRTAKKVSFAGLVAKPIKQ